MMDRSHSGECAVPAYRFYVFEKNGHVTGPPIFYELPNDDAALEEAKKILNDRAIEVWRGVNKVGRLEPVILAKFL
jgi:hypothetical protein